MNKDLRQRLALVTSGATKAFVPEHSKSLDGDNSVLKSDKVVLQLDLGFIFKT